MSKPIYVPTLRSRQQENLVLDSFEFTDQMIPMVEIIKEHDRARVEGKQQSFKDIYTGILSKIKAKKVFVDLPIYLKQRASMKDEVISFLRATSTKMDARTEALLSLSGVSDKSIIPIVSSFFQINGKENTVESQVHQLRKTYSSIGFRILVTHFSQDWEEVVKCCTAEDYIILDLDTLPPYPSPVVKAVLQSWINFNLCPKIVLRSAINTDIQNNSLNHNSVVFDADNGLLETFRQSFRADGFGDYAGVKKDDLTSGGAISPGFLFYDAVDNQFIGFKGEIRSLDEFADTIVPAVMNSEAATKMKKSGCHYLVNENWGWRALSAIAQWEESGKSQAKFKRIAIEHYLHCIRIKLLNGIIT